MNKRNLLILTATSILGVSCNLSSSNESYLIKTICPAGAPTFAFYDQGANTEGFFTTSVPTDVSKELLGITYDCVVFDSINGLRAIKKNNSDYKLKTLITGGNFYLVSYDLDENHIPSVNDRVVSFGEGNLPDLVYKKLLSSYTGWTNWNMPEATYLAGTADVSAALISHQYDYYFIAEPSLTAAKASLGSDASKVKVVANLKDTWKLYSGQNAIPQAGLFVKSSSYTNHQAEIEEYVSALNLRKDICVSNPLEAKNSIDTWNSDQLAQKARFGFASTIAYNVQKDNKNGLGIVKSDDISNIMNFINEFIGFLDNPSYTSFAQEYFL